MSIKDSLYLLRVIWGVLVGLFGVFYIGIYAWGYFHVPDLPPLGKTDWWLIALSSGAALSLIELVKKKPRFRLVCNEEAA